mgnify:CR=1 FL=1
MSPEQDRTQVPEPKREIDFFRKKAKPSGFEPFVNPEQNQKDNLFVNAYAGSFSQNMELNRKAIEQTLRLAHLDGKIVLTSLAYSRNRSIDGVNSDGSTPAKKSVFW